MPFVDEAGMFFESYGGYLLNLHRFFWTQYFAKQFEAVLRRSKTTDFPSCSSRLRVSGLWGRMTASREM